MEAEKNYHFSQIYSSNRESNREDNTRKTLLWRFSSTAVYLPGNPWRRQHLSTNMTYLYVVMTDRFISFVIARLSLWSSYKKFVLLSSAADFDLCCRKGTLLLSLKNQGQNIVCWGNRFQKEYGSTNMCKESFKPSKTVVCSCYSYSFNIFMDLQEQ